MRVKPRHLFAAAIVAACGYVAAPALSARPYIPEALDFEQGLPRLGRVAEPPNARAGRDPRPGTGPVSFKSAVIVAPEHFDLAGVAGELRPLELRGREDGGEWTPWVETANADPVYFGGADELQVRSRGWRPSGTIHYVNVSGTTGELGGILTAARRAVNSAFISAAAVLDPEAEALPARPEIIKRSEWGATRSEGGCRPRATPAKGVVKAAAVHHTVTANRYSEAEAPAIVLGICRFHRNGNGWNDIGYNALVDRFGNVYAGRAGGVRKPIVGAHAQGFNSETTGVASIGTHTSTPISTATKGALVDYLAWKLSVHGLRATGKTTLTSAGGEASRYPRGHRVRLNRVIGHRAVGLTACPGEALEVTIPRLRHLIQHRIDQGGGAPPVEEEPPGGVAPKRAQPAR